MRKTESSRNDKMLKKNAIIHWAYIYVISEQKNKQPVWGKLVALFRCSFSDFYQVATELDRALSSDRKFPAHVGWY